jgi:regulator of telomere elongation helicase 1
VLKSLNKKLNAFIESPTGTGKTLCMLTSTLAWVHHRKMTLNENNRVLYISRTHSQLDQVAKELRETCYRPTMAIMGSREKFCINKKGEGLKNNKLR